MKRAATITLAAALTVFVCLPAGADRKLLVGDISVTGSKKTDPNVIFTEIRVRTRDPYTSDMASEIRKRVMNLRYFSKVTVTEDIDEAAGVVDLTIMVLERMTWGIVPIIDIDGDDSDNHRLGLRMEENNAFGMGKTVNRIWHQTEFSGDWVINVRDPQVLSTNWTAGLGIYTMWIDDINYWDAVAGGYVSVGYRPTYEASVTVQFNRRFDDYEDLDAASTWPSDATTNTLELILGYDDTAYELTSVAGLGASLSVERGMEGIGSDYEFSKTSFDVRYGLLGPRDHWLLLKLSGGIGEDLDAVHDGHEYFLVGGTSSIRGYLPEYAGGDRFLTTSAQYEAPFWKPSLLAFSGVFSAVAFLDHGYAWLDSGTKDLGDAVTGAGGGLRLYVNEMPSVILHIDYGYGFETEEFQPHFSISGAF